MANYGYANHGYTTSNDMDPRYGGGYTYSNSDHVCRPVIIDAEGRKQPIISYTPKESYVVKRETIIERVHSPIAEYKNYAVHNDKWRRPSSPTDDRDRPHTKIEHYRYGSGSPTKYEVNDDKWHGPSSPIHDRDRPNTMIEHYKYSSGSPTKYEVNDDKLRRPSSPNYDRPRKVEEFITKVQTEVSQPQIGPLTGSYWRNSANPTGHTESTGYGDWNKPKLAPLGWTKPASRPLTGPTTDINEAVNFFKEAVKSSSITTGAPNSRYTEPVSGFSKKDGYSETIDSTEAKRRYARPLFKTSESYNGTINSKDAINKYGGAFVP